MTNVAFINGLNDPWRRLSVLEDLSDSSPAMVISGEGHCSNTRASKGDDSLPLVDAKDRILDLITKWTTDEPKWRVNTKVYSPPKTYKHYQDENEPLPNVYHFDQRAIDGDFYSGSTYVDYHDSDSDQSDQYSY